MRPGGRLWLCGLLSLGVYLVAFVLPYRLPHWAARGAPADLGKLTGYSWGGGLGYFAALLALFALYVLALASAPQGAPQQGIACALGLGITCAVVLCWVYPYAAADIFLYLVRGRVLGIYGQNSLRVPPAAFPLADYLPFPSEWAETPSPYGPLWEWLAAGLARLGDGSLVRSLLAFKGLALVSYVGCALILWRLLRAEAPQRALQGLVAFAWNPLVLLEAHAMGHNDLVMMVWVLLALWLWRRGWYSGALVALVVGALVKYVPLLLVPPALLLLWRRLGPRAWWRTVLRAGLVSAALVALTLAPLWPGWAAWEVGGQLSRGHNSLGVWLILALRALVPEPLAFDLGLWASRLGFLAAYGLILAQSRSRPPHLPYLFHRILYAWLLLGAFSFGYWYIAWLIALLPLLPEGKAWGRTLLFAWCGLLSVCLYTFGGRWSGVDYLTVCLVVIPLVLGAPLLWGPRLALAPSE